VRVGVENVDVIYIDVSRMRCSASIDLSSLPPDSYIGEMLMVELELKYEFLCELTASLGDPQEIGGACRGTRKILPVTGGKIEGPKIRGKLLPFGADWLITRPDGVQELDVRLTTQTDDGELIYIYYGGLYWDSPEVNSRFDKGEPVDPSEYYFRTTPTFETGSEKYGWLNSIICVGVGKIIPGGVHYKIYEIL
jgi:hypothetical protein